jgi:hypothetical protein
VLETEQPDATESQAARAHRIVTGVLLRWCAEFGFSKAPPAKLAAARIADERQAARTLQARSWCSAGDAANSARCNRG